jgi:hypothetical protein
VSDRKFFTELGIHVTVLGQYLGRQRELETLPRFPEKCNLYIVTRRPRITVDPQSVSFDGNRRMRGIVRLQRGEAFEEVPFDIPIDKLGRRPLTYSSEWPYDLYRIVNDEGREVASGVVALAAVSFGMLHPRRASQEVVYVGQSFGKAGERTAFDRLKSHSTLQRIYAECRPDMDVWLSLCKISDLHLLAEFNPLVPARTPDSVDDEHRDRVLKRIHGAGFDEREAVAIAEAGLIRYFQPVYNKMYRDNYPDPRHVHISTCFELELAVISVELQGQELLSVYRSEAIPKASTFHYCRYLLHETAGFIKDWYGGRPVS